MMFMYSLFIFLTVIYFANADRRPFKQAGEEHVAPITLSGFCTFCFIGQLPLENRRYDSLFIRLIAFSFRAIDLEFFVLRRTNIL